MDFTQDQIDKLNSLGIEVESQEQNIISPLDVSLLSKGETAKPRGISVFPLLSISGLTLLSFSGLILLKSKNQANVTQTPSPIRSPQDVGGPTQVPKSIQHYLLTSQQYFSQALQLQNENRPVKGGGTEGDGGFQTQTLDLLNQSILAATQAIKEFPQDYRGYQQRGRIYQALIDSKPELIDQSISDLASALKLNSNSSEITHTLASLYAKKGDAQKTILYLSQTVALDPTKAQNFYDLAKIQQQAGLLPQALETYTKLITLVTDSNQKTQVESEKSALEKLISQNPDVRARRDSPSIQEDTPIQISTDAPTIQASTGSNLIIADSQQNNSVTVTNQTDSNSFSGNSILPSNQKEITINNSQINTTSQVYVTVTNGGKNQKLSVLSKSNGSFTVGLDTPLSEDIEFKWWIIN